MKKALIIMILFFVFLNGCGTTNKLPGKTISPDITETSGESIYSVTAYPNKDVPNDSTPYPDLISSGEKASNNNYKDGMLLLRDISYGGKKVLDLEYNELLEIWGSPAAVNKDKVQFSATEEYNVLYTLSFDGIDIEMYPVEEGTLCENTYSFRFDITGDKYSFEDMRIGMDIDEFNEVFENKEIYDLKSVLYGDDSGAPVEIKKLLTDLKDKDRYRAFEKAAYIPGAMVDDNDEMTGAVGFVLLFNGDKLCRIVYGLPTAG